jgi:hypothetical protein
MATFGTDTSSAPSPELSSRLQELDESADEYGDQTSFRHQPIPPQPVGNTAAQQAGRFTQNIRQPGTQGPSPLSDNSTRFAVQDHPDNPFAKAPSRARAIPPHQQSFMNTPVNMPTAVATGQPTQSRIAGTAAELASAKSATGVANLPVADRKDSPKTFTGKSHAVEKFLKHYESLLKKNHITVPADKCSAIIQYCSHGVQDLLEALPEFISGDWDGLRAQIMYLYDAAKAKTKYKESDLQKFINQWKKKKMEKLDDWVVYERGFLRIANPLKTHGDMSEDMYNLRFWSGIHPTFSQNLEDGLSRRYPDHDMEQPYSRYMVDKEAQYQLKREKFTTRIARTDSEDSDNTISDSDSTEDEIDSESDSDYSYKKKKKKKKSKSKTKSKTKTRDEDKKTKAAEQAAERHQKLVAGMIDQLQHMDINSDKYASLYYLAFLKDKEIAQIVRPPPNSAYASAALPNQRTAYVNRTSNMANPGGNSWVPNNGNPNGNTWAPP